MAEDNDATLWAQHPTPRKGVNTGVKIQQQAGEKVPHANKVMA